MSQKNTFLDYDLSSNHSEIKNLMMRDYGWQDAVEHDGKILHLVNTKLWKPGENDLVIARTQFEKCAERLKVVDFRCIAFHTDFPNGEWAFRGRIENAMPKPLLQPYMKQTTMF